MPSVDNFLLFIAAGLLLNITPGPDMLYIITRSAAQGRKAGVISALGIGTGTFVHIAAAALGLSTLLMYSTEAYNTVRCVGAMYLIYLGLRVILFQNNDRQNQQIKNESLWKIYREAVVINVLNPKVAIFFLAFLPQFITPDWGQVGLQIIFLGAIFDINSTIVNILVALLFGYVGTRLMRHPIAVKFQTWLPGSIFIGLGLHLIFSENK